MVLEHLIRAGIRALAAEDTFIVSHAAFLYHGLHGKAHGAPGFAQPAAGTI